MPIIDITTKDSLLNATNTLKSGGVLVFPTDTVYGIGCILSELAAKKLYKIKNRRENKPTAVLMTEGIFENVSTFEGQIPTEFWIGKMTIIFKIKDFNIKFPEIITENNTIGVRLPHYVWLENLIDEVGPIIASSANKNAEKTPVNFSEISNEILNEVDLVIKTNEDLSVKASTILDITKNHIIRD